MSRHNTRPKKSENALRAWEAFEVLFGHEPDSIHYGHGTAYGWCWTADKNGAIAIYKASWSNAIFQTRASNHCAS